MVSNLTAFSIQPVFTDIVMLHIFFNRGQTGDVNSTGL